VARVTDSQVVRVHRYRAWATLITTLGLIQACTFNRSRLDSQFSDDSEQPDTERAQDVQLEAELPRFPTDFGSERPLSDATDDGQGDDMRPDPESGLDVGNETVEGWDMLNDSILSSDPTSDSGFDGTMDPVVHSDGDVAPYCGDGRRNGTDDCEDDDLGGADCETFDYDLGTLSCSVECRFDTTRCVNVPGDWLDEAWLYRKAIRINADRVAQDEVDFPILVSLVDEDLAARALPSGDDLVFTTSDGTTLVDFELEEWTSADGTLVAWVEVAELSSSEDTAVYLYYGNPTPEAPSAGSPWDALYEAVWHFNEPTVDEQTTGTHIDATGNGHAGSQNGNAAGSGQIAGAQHFDGDDRIDVSGSETIQLGDTSVTISAWIRTTSTSPMGIVVKSPPDSHVPDDKLFGVNHDTDRLGIDQGWVTYLGANTTITDGEWHHVAWVQVFDSSGVNERWRLYVDGNHEANKLANTDTDPGGHVVRIGDGVPGSYFAGAFDGAIDEVRISNTVRSDGWISTSFDNQSAPSTFLTVDDEEALLP
jgi:hypothetical protein